MYVNTLITFQENASTYGLSGKRLQGHITLNSPGRIMCYVQNLKNQPSDITFGLYVFSKASQQGVRVGPLKQGKETKWLVNEKNILDSGLKLEEIDGAAVVAESMLRGTEMVLSGFKENRYMIIPIIDDLFKKIRKPFMPPPPPKPGPGMPPPPAKPGTGMPPPPPKPVPEMPPSPPKPAPEMPPSPPKSKPEMPPSPPKPVPEMPSTFPKPRNKGTLVQPDQINKGNDMGPLCVCGNDSQNDIPLEPGPVVSIGSGTVQLGPGPVISESEPVQQEPGPVIAESDSVQQEPELAKINDVQQGMNANTSSVNNTQNEINGDTFEEGMANKVKILDHTFNEEVIGESLDETNAQLIKIVEKLKEPEKEPAIKKENKSGIPYASTNIPQASVIRKNQEDNKQLSRIIEKIKEDEQVQKKAKSIEEQIEKMRTITKSHQLLGKPSVERKVESIYISKQSTLADQEMEEEEEVRDCAPRQAHSYLAAESSGEMESLLNNEPEVKKSEMTDHDEMVDYLDEMEKKIKQIEEKRKADLEAKNRLEQ